MPFRTHENERTSVLCLTPRKASYFTKLLPPLLRLYHPPHMRPTAATITFLCSSHLLQGLPTGFSLYLESFVPHLPRARPVIWVLAPIWLLEKDLPWPQSIKQKPKQEYYRHQFTLYSIILLYKDSLIPGRFKVLAHPLLRIYINGCLDKHKGLKDKQELR